MKNRLPFLFLFLLSSWSILAQDTLKTPLKIGALMRYDISSIAFYGGVGVSLTYQKFELSLAYIVDYSKAEFPTNGPVGFATTLAFSPNPSPSKTINHFLNIDYRMVWHKRHCIYDCSKKYNHTYEISFGYGISIQLLRRLALTNAINVGWHIENAYSDRTSENINSFGHNTLLQTRLNYQF